jgi:16S rRNA (cytidine1402-2'-O)-methyltransferase
MNQNHATSHGVLYLVATPIGNLKDVTIRALETLKSVDLILAEDTRHAKIFLQAYQIPTPVHAFHMHNENTTATHWIEQLIQGKDIALISDAGTPLIQDPGYPLIHLATQHGLSIVPIPGACAIITALCASGMPCDQFLFAGFLPAKSQARQEELERLKSSGCTVVVYESTHRLMDSLNQIAEVYGPAHPMVIAKELTKTFERFERAPVQELIQTFRSESTLQKGEFVLILSPYLKADAQQHDEFLLKTLLSNLPLKQSVAIAEKLSKTSKNQLYELALLIKKSM